MSLQELGVYGPLKPDHPLVKDNSHCWICDKRFYPGQRTALIALEAPEDQAKTVEAKVVHATCFLRGREVQTPKGLRIVDHVKDGDGSPFPIVTTDLKQWREEEISAL